MYLVLLYKNHFQNLYVLVFWLIILHVITEWSSKNMALLDFLLKNNVDMLIRLAAFIFMSADYFHKCWQSSCSWTEATDFSSSGIYTSSMCLSFHLLELIACIEPTNLCYRRWLLCAKLHFC